MGLAYHLVTGGSTATLEAILTLATPDRNSIALPAHMWLGYSLCPLEKFLTSNPSTAGCARKLPSGYDEIAAPHSRKGNLSLVFSMSHIYPPLQQWLLCCYDGMRLSPSRSGSQSSRISAVSSSKEHHQRHCQGGPGGSVLAILQKNGGLQGLDAALSQHGRPLKPQE